MKYYLILCLTTAYGTGAAQQGQVAIDRVELMPNLPTPFNLRDWHSVALSYDTFVYDINRTGQYLPLISVQQSGVNYPQNSSFGMHSYVGTNSPNAGEAINILPSLVGATLNGADKRDQYGRDWILMSQDYFNHVNGENLYLNNRGGHSGSDWWYDMMPNIYFYQLYDLYGDVGESRSQFSAVADQMEKAVRAMGGSTAPWTAADMNYRAWDFIEMTGNASGVHEPEAAGAYGWLLYNAWHETGNADYLKGAEWSIEFLDGLSTNPSYELQLPYGVYAAARMNAELQTTYDMEKLVAWVFNRGPLRGWGTIVGKWGSFDVSGLVGEANDGGNDYAFQMNGVQQAAAMVPMVRYDKRFSRAIAKWFLNMTNATRLMFPRFLPAAYQDASDWSDVYDPQAVLGYEALREKYNGFSPFSTGDALNGGWAGTNLALYGTSSIGYLGALFTPTNENRIPLLDLLKTDFLRDTAYPSFLLFNPYDTDKEITLNVGDSFVDIYDVITETFLAQGVNGEVTLTIPADEVRSLVYAPAGGTITYDQNKMLINDVVVDFQQHAEAYNSRPRIKGIGFQKPQVEFGDTSLVYGTVSDQDASTLTYQWQASGGVLTGTDAIVKWTAPDEPGNYEIRLVAEDEAGQTDTAFATIVAVAEINTPPVIHDVVTDRIYAEPDQVVEVTCIADDPNGDPLTYTWGASAGSVDGSGSSVFWTSPSNPGIYAISVTVADDEGATSMTAINILVHTFGPTSGNVVADYPFSGNALDQSGNDHHGTVLGPKLVQDRFGNPASAYEFDGVNDHITVPNAAGLNFSGGITVSCWFKPITLPDREVFIISHGSWQNRWKLSVTPEGLLRWTLKTAGGSVRDIDSATKIEVGEIYQAAATYDGELLLLYLNGRLEGIASLNGAINTTTYSLEIGQMLSDNQAYNFRGVIDDIRIYDYALHPDSIAGNVTAIRNISQLSKGIRVFPNPVRDALQVVLEEPGWTINAWTIYDQRGAPVRGVREATAQQQLIIPISDLANGFYTFKCTTTAGARIVPFVKLE